MKTKSPWLQVNVARFTPDCNSEDLWPYSVGRYLLSEKCDGCGAAICTSLHDHSRYDDNGSLNHHTLGLCSNCWNGLSPAQQQDPQRIVLGNARAASARGGLPNGH
jgi:hypothetical protein